MYPRFIEASVRAALEDTRVVAIAGPRQSGKSTLARAIAGAKAAYLSLDEAVNFKAAADDPTGFIRRTSGLTVIDEIQRVPELMLAIKLSVDENPAPGRFLIAGSADIRTLPAIQDSLAGRIQVFELLPLSRDEIAGRRSAFLSDVFAGRLPKGSALDPEELPRLVAAGGFPEAVARTSRGAPARLAGGLRASARRTGRGRNRTTRPAPRLAASRRTAGAALRGVGQPHAARRPVGHGPQDGRPACKYS